MTGLFLLHCCLATPLFGGYKPTLAMDFKGASYLFDGYKPTTRRKATIGCRTALPIEVTIEQGKAVFEYAKTLVTPAKLEASVLQGTLRLPNGFWQSFFPDIVKRSYGRVLEQMYRKAFRFYLQALTNGAVTICGVMGEKNRGQRRLPGGELNSLKCPELGQHLYSWFIDCVQVLRCRVVASLLMQHARFLKQRLLELGYQLSKLPTLRGSGGRSWFGR